MEYFSSTIVLYSIAIASFIIFLRRRNTAKNRQPPGPPAWPVFGHTFSLGSMPHRTLAGLKQQYGPVIWLKIGAINTMVILSAKAAAELFKNHDITFADRSIIETMKACDYHKGSLALAPYGAYWRVLRRICTVEMVVPKKMNETVAVRRKCIDDMLTWIEKEGKNPIQVTKFVFLASFNMLGNLMISRDLLDPESIVGSEFFDAMMKLMEWTGHPNVSDLFPCLRWLDLQNLRRRMDRDMGKALEIAAGFVKQRLIERANDGKKKMDFLDVLLDFEGSGKDEPEKLAERDINILILEIFQAGTETTSSTTEWAMTELFRNPATMRKLKSELQSVVGPSKKFEESDIDNLPYLHAVIQETLRLHPPIPFLVPRKATRDADFMGYHIPKGTQLFVNVWALGRDEECWDDPCSFKPERFLGSKIEYKGQNFEFIPFGAGRRMCAGIPLGHRMLHLVLGSLIHTFDWELEAHVTPESIDMKDKMGVTVRKLEPLIAVPKRSCVI